jgi:hypothetical protein
MNRHEGPRVHLEAITIFVINLLIFFGVFWLSFSLLKGSLHLSAVDVPLVKSGFDYKGLDNILQVKKYTPMIGIAISAVFSVMLLILMLIFSGFRRRSHKANIIIFAVVWMIFALLAYDLLFIEDRYTAIGSAVKSFVGVPLSIALIAIAAVNAAWYYYRNITKAGKALFLVSALICLCSCSLSELFPCSSDSDHCIQFGAVQSGNTDTCDKIAGSSFSGQNPPKDKCYLMTAVNLGRYDICDKIAGGMNSYTRDECRLEVAIAKQDRETCDKLRSGGMDVDCSEKIPEKGDNPLKSGEKAVAQVTDIRGDVRVIKEDGRNIPLIRDSVLGPRDRIASIEEGSTFTITIEGGKSYPVPQNTMLIMSPDLELLDNACAAAPGIR